jgi:hypothetical protein
MEITSEYNRLCKYPSDINEHLPTLYTLATECSTICECGVRSIVSTWAFLKGLAEVHKHNGHLCRLYCVDLDFNPNINNVAKCAASSGIALCFYENDSATVSLPEAVDMLFIDTWHIYGHLKRELEYHHNNVKKYIVMHDTEVDKIHGETIRCGMDAVTQSKQTGYLIEEIKKGLQFAIDEFLSVHTEWSIYKHYSNNNGLTILKRNSSLNTEDIKK